MPTIDLSQLPQPAIIESLDYGVILAQTKTFMISVFPEAMRDEVAAALELESEPLNIIAQAMAWRELLLRQWLTTTGMTLLIMLKRQTMLALN